MHTGSIIDFYDDPHGHVLKERLPDPEQVPDFVKTAEHLPDDVRHTLPDDVFALVMVDRGEKLRKYACVDKGNTALSVLYFMETHDKLPEEAQKVAAANLLTACGWHDLEAPLALTKIAGVASNLKSGYQAGRRIAKGEAVRGLFASPLTGGTDLASKAGRFAGVHRNKLLAAAAGTAALGGGVAAAKKLKGRKSEEIEKDAGLGKLLNVGSAGLGMQSSISEGAKRHKATMAGMPKVGDLTGSSVMPHQSTSEVTDVTNRGVKTAAVMQPHVDVTGQQAPPQMEKVASQRFALVKEGSGHFPLDTYGEVVEAQRWFHDHGESLHPEDRREFCIKVASRGDEIGAKVTDHIRKYAGQGFAPDGEIKVAVSTRMQYFADDSGERDMLQGLMDKYASVEPEVFCESLRQFDELTGLEHQWDEGIYDPWYSTFGFVKEAEWSFEHAGDKIDEERLKGLVNSEATFTRLTESFGDDMAKSLRKSPKEIFSSLPLDTKRIIMRMANDPQPTFRH
jgi:hypothetical protein